MDSIYALNYLINRQLAKRGGKMMAMFVDLRTAFDSVNRGLVKAMREKGIREGLISRVKELLREQGEKRRREEDCFRTARR